MSVKSKDSDSDPDEPNYYKSHLHIAEIDCQYSPDGDCENCTLSKGINGEVCPYIEENS